MKSHCSDNYTKFGRDLGLNPAFLHSYLKTGVGEDKKLVYALMDFCDKRHLNYLNYFEK